MPQSTTTFTTPEQRSAFAADTKATQVSALQRALDPSGSSELPWSARASLGMAGFASKAIEGRRQHDPSDSLSATSFKAPQTPLASSTTNGPQEPVYPASSGATKSKFGLWSRNEGSEASRRKRPTTDDPQELPPSASSAKPNASSGKIDPYSHWTAQEPKGIPWA